MLASGTCFAAAAAVATAALRHRAAARCKPPRAARKPYTFYCGAVAEDRGDNAMTPPEPIHDDLFWLRDDTRSDPEVLGHIDAENCYTTGQLAPLSEPIDRLFLAMKRRMDESSRKPPAVWGEYAYYTRTEAGQAYRLHCRKPRAVPLMEYAQETVYLDENVVAAGHEYCVVGHVAVCPQGQQLFAYSVDVAGDEVYDVRFAAMPDAPGSVPAPADVIEGTNGSIKWGRDGKEVFYVKQDSRQRPFQVWRHVLGTAPADDELLFEEPNAEFRVHVSTAADRTHLLIETSSKITTEMHYVQFSTAPAVDQPMAPALQCFRVRKHDVLYMADFWHDAAAGDGSGAWVVCTNDDGCTNFKICVAAPHDTGKWVTVFGHQPGALVEDLDVFQDCFAVTVRENALCNVYIGDSSTWRRAATEGATPSSVPLVRLGAAEDVYTMQVGRNLEYQPEELRYVYASFITPMQACHVPVAEALARLDQGAAQVAETEHGAQLHVRELAATEARCVWQQHVPHYDRSQYAVARINALAADGETVPISLVYKPSALGVTAAQVQAALAAGQRVLPGADGAPVLLSGYSAYGYSEDAYFSYSMSAVLDLGMVWATAHCRGGCDKGRNWYLSGKMEHKHNTFSDFHACAQHLCALGWTAPGRIAVEGGSAGGLVVGTAITQHPEMYGAALGHVPFVDPILSLADPSVPLATEEWTEFGNPNVRDQFDSIMKWSPLQNVRPAMFPPTLLTAGLHDPRVGFWEAAKFAQRLRDAQQASAAILLWVDKAGHFAASDRYKHLRERARDYGWVAHTLGLRW